ncbi:MAG: T9SS type A sorting domain-containing protein [Ignavibacteria bacterium]|nr:T9SS type A sorting domain-containing protein [Ignavibacteria bacterium]
MIKRIIVANFLSLILINSNLYAQTFIFDANPKQKADTLGSEVVFDISLVNLTNDSLSLYILRTVNDLPVGWESSLCFGQLCFAPFIDSVTTSPEYGAYPIPPHDSIPFSLHVYIGNAHGTARFQLIARTFSNPIESHILNLTVTSKLTSIDYELSKLNDFKLFQNYPNPFNSLTNIEFSLPNSEIVKVKLYNLIGKEIATLIDERLNEGNYKLLFDASKFNLSSGSYFYSLEVGNRLITKRMTFLK